MARRETLVRRPTFSFWDVPLRRLLTITAALALVAPLAPLTARPAAAEPAAKTIQAASPPTGCSVSGQGAYSSDSCSIGTARTDYSGITFSHVNNGPYAYCTSADQLGGCIQAIHIEPGDYGPNATDGLSCDFQPAPDQAEHAQYTLHYPQIGGANDAYAVAAEGGFSCQSTDVRGQVVDISLSPCGYSGAGANPACPPGLTGDPGLQTFKEIDYKPGNGPAASFTSTTVTTPPNTVNFDASGSSDGSGTISSYAWDFGDGSTSTKGPTVSHTYAMSGTYSTTLTITDGNGRTASISNSVAVNADLTSAIAVTDPQGNPFTGTATAVGNSLMATVTLTASTSASAPITGVVPSPVLAVSPDGKVTQSSMPAVPDGGYTLKPGESATYQVSFVINGTGTVTFSMSASGMEGPNTESTTVQKVVHLGQPLQVDVALQNTDGTPLVLSATGQPDQPNTLKLADDDNGETPQDVKVVVTFTNISANQLNHVVINGVPALSFHNPSQAFPVLPVGVSAGPGVPAADGTTPTQSLPDLAPGATATATYTLHVTKNGVFDFSPQVLSSDQDDVNDVSQGVATLTAIPTHLLVLSLTAKGTSSIRAGDSVIVEGTLTNRSQTQTLDVDPLEPVDVTGNVGGGRLVDYSSSANVALSLLADGVQLPFFGDLKPGEIVQLTGKLDTTVIPATRAKLSYDPHASIKNDDGSETDLTAKQIRVTAGTSPITLTINASDPVVPLANNESVIANFTNGAALGAAEWSAGELRGAYTIARHPIDAGGAALHGLASMVVHGQDNLTSAAYILTEAEIYAAAWVILTPAQRGAFEKHIIDDFDTSKLKANNKEMSDSIQASMNGFVSASNRGDYGALANLAGHGLASGGGIVADYLLQDIFFQKLSLGLKATAKAGRAAVTGELASALILGDEIKNAHLPESAFKAGGIKAGQNLLASNAKALTGVWGLTSTQVSKLTAFCKENEIIIAVRQRSARAAKLIERGLAIGKNEILKLKGVNEIDTGYLGYSQSDLNLLVFAEPIPLSELYPKLRNLSKQARAAVLERYDMRVAEWTSPKVRGVMEEANKTKEIEWGFNGKDNGAPAADRLAKRRFSLVDRKDYKMPDGQTARVYQEVYVGSKPGLGGRLVRVTQDVDLAALLSSNGEILSAPIRTKLYQYLSDVLGIEHPETVSWVDNGELEPAARTLFKGKLKELSRLLPGGGETLAVFGADGSVRAGYLDAASTIYDARTGGGRIFFHGGYNDPYAKTIARITVSLKNFFQ